MKSKTQKVKINLHPTPGYLIIEPQQKDEKTASGIYLPESASDKPQKGVVIAVGDDEITDTGKKKSPAKISDIVIFKKWGGSEVKIDGVEYLFAKFDDILAIQK